MFDYLIGTALMRGIFGPAFDKPTFQKCLGLISFVLIALFITGAGFYQSRSVEAQLARLATEAVQGRAVVIDKHETWRSNSTHYDITLEHVTSDGVRHRANHGTGQIQFEAAKVGGSVPIIYLRSDPDTFYLGGDEPTAAMLSAMQWLFRIGLGCLALALGLLVWQWPRAGDEGGAHPRRPAPEQAARAAPSGGPAVFGKRR